MKLAYPDQAYGSQSVLGTWKSNSNGERYAVFLFDASGFEGLRSAKSIHFAAEAQSHSPDVPFIISLRPYGDYNWTESSLTWNTFSVSEIGPSLGAKSIQQNVVFHWNVTAWHHSNPSQATFSFVLVMDESTDLESSWWSKEGNYAPRLRINDSSLSP